MVNVEYPARVVNPEEVDARRLADVLVSRLRAVVPEGLSITAKEDEVLVSAGQLHGGTPLEGLVDQDDTFEEGVIAGAWAVLDAVQDFISEFFLKAPWPDPEGVNRMAMPKVEWQGEMLRLCYGDLEDPVLELPSISLQELKESA